VADEVTTLEPVVVTAPAVTSPVTVDLGSLGTGFQNPNQLLAVAHQLQTNALLAGGPSGVPATTVGANYGVTGDWPVQYDDFSFGPASDITVADPTYYDDPAFTTGTDIPATLPAPSNDINWPDISELFGGSRSPSMAGAGAGFGGQLGSAARRAAQTVPASFQGPMTTTAAARGPLMLPPGPGGAASGAAAAVRGLLMQASRNIGGRVTLANVVALAKKVGVGAAGVALGLAFDAIMWLISYHTVKTSRRRRGRGVTSRQIRTARSTIRRMESFHRLVVQACAPTRGSYRRRTRGHAAGCGCVVCRRT